MELGGGIFILVGPYIYVYGISGRPRGPTFGHFCQYSLQIVHSVHRSHFWALLPKFPLKYTFYTLVSLLGTFAKIPFKVYLLYIGLTFGHFHQNPPQSIPSIHRSPFWAFSPDIPSKYAFYTSVSLLGTFTKIPLKVCLLYISLTFGHFCQNSPQSIPSINRSHFWALWPKFPQSIPFYMYIGLTFGHFRQNSPQSIPSIHRSHFWALSPKFPSKYTFYM